MVGPVSEGNLKAPTRHPLDWQNPDFYDEASLHKEMERVFDICHGCRRCVSLCQSFPTLFDLVDSSESMEVDGVRTEDYWKVVEQCYLCDLCYMTKCPYVPPHAWNCDFPHLMLRAKAVHYKTKGARLARQGADQHRRARRAAGQSGHGAGRQPDQFDPSGAARAAGGRGHRRESLDSEIRLAPPAQAARDPAERDGGRTGRPHDRQDRAVRHLLHQPQRAGAGRGSRRGVRAQRHSGDADAAREMLRHAAARTRRSRNGASAQGDQHSGPRQAGRPRLGPDGARALLRADVQAGAAADVSGRRRT